MNNSKDHHNDLACNRRKLQYVTENRDETEKRFFATEAFESIYFLLRQQNRSTGRNKVKTVYSFLIRLRCSEHLEIYKEKWEIGGDSEIENLMLIDQKQLDDALRYSELTWDHLEIVENQTYQQGFENHRCHHEFLIHFLNSKGTKVMFPNHAFYAVLIECVCGIHWMKDYSKNNEMYRNDYQKQVMEVLIEFYKIRWNELVPQIEVRESIDKLKEHRYFNVKELYNRMKRIKKDYFFSNLEEDDMLSITSYNNVMHAYKLGFVAEVREGEKIPVWIARVGCLWSWFSAFCVGTNFASRIDKDYLENTLQSILPNEYLDETDMKNFLDRHQLQSGSSKNNVQQPTQVEVQLSSQSDAAPQVREKTMRLTCIALENPHRSYEWFIADEVLHVMALSMTLLGVQNPIDDTRYRDFCEEWKITDEAFADHVVLISRAQLSDALGCCGIDFETIEVVDHLHCKYRVLGTHRNIKEPLYFFTVNGITAMFPNHAMCAVFVQCICGIKWVRDDRQVEGQETYRIQVTDLLERFSKTPRNLLIPQSVVVKSIKRLKQHNFYRTRKLEIPDYFFLRSSKSDEVTHDTYRSVANAYNLDIFTILCNNKPTDRSPKWVIKLLLIAGWLKKLQTWGFDDLNLVAGLETVTKQEISHDGMSFLEIILQLDSPFVFHYSEDAEHPSGSQKRPADDLPDAVTKYQKLNPRYLSQVTEGTSAGTSSEDETVSDEESGNASDESESE